MTTDLREVTSVTMFSVVGGGMVVGGLDAILIIYKVLIKQQSSASW